MADRSARPRADMDTIVSLCKRRGFVFPSAEIYGGFANTYDYGPLGVELRRQIRAAWWRAMVQERDDVVGIEAAIITNPRVYVASGHLEHFSDPLVDCRACKTRFRADDLPGATIHGAGATMTVELDPAMACPSCGASGSFTEARQFNLMFETNVGPLRDASSTAYLRPETAQGMFVNFENVLNASRRKLPFGIAQNGKSFRNEITPGNFIFRMLEFEQMEMEYFCYPEQGRETYEYWREERMRWYVARLGVAPERLHFREHPKEALSHYSSGTTDIEYEFPFGWGELEGIAYRTDFDLRRHSELSGRQLSYFDDERKLHIVPHVVEPAAGVDRIMAVLLLDAYDEEQDDRGETRVLLHFKAELAPVQVAILPLSRNEKLVPTARDVWTRLRPHFRTQYDDAQSIGRRYRRQDEIGTPLCVTVDFQTVEEDQAVTIRDRDSMEQIRVPIEQLVGRLTGSPERTVKLLHFADLHIGVENYGRLDPVTGFSTRLLDFLRAFDELVDCALSERVDLVLFAGDAYKSREPTQTHQREFARRIRRLRAADIPVFLLIGNHDLPNAVSRANALEIFQTLELEGVYVAPRIGAYRIPTRSGDLQIVAVPWPNQSVLLSRDEYKNQTIDQIDRTIEDILTREIVRLGEEQDPSLLTVLTAHIALSESRVKTGSEKWMTVGHFPSLLPSSLRAELFDYVALGHHHVHQQLGDRPPIVYPGSLQRVDFGEEKDPKGFVLLELDPSLPRGERAVRIEFREVHARRFVTIAVTPREDDPTEEVLEAIARADVREAIVRLQLQLRPSQDALLRDADLRRGLEGAHYIASIGRDVEQPARRRLSTEFEPEQLTAGEALKLYLQQKGVPADEQTVLLEYADRLIAKHDRP